MPGAIAIRTMQGGTSRDERAPQGEGRSAFAGAPRLNLRHDRRGSERSGSSFLVDVRRPPLPRRGLHGAERTGWVFRTATTRRFRHTKTPGHMGRHPVQAAPVCQAPGAPRVAEAARRLRTPFFSAVADKAK